MSNCPIVKQAKVSDRILISESQGAGCVAFDVAHSEELIAKLKTVQRRIEDENETLSEYER